MTTLTNDIRAKVPAFLKRTGMPDEQFGKLALGRPQFVEDLAGQQTMTLKTADRLLQFLGEAPIGPVFRREIEAFLDVTAIRPAKLGTKAAGYPWFVGTLEEGGSARLSAVERVRAWMVETATPSERAAIARMLEGSGSAIFNDGASTSLQGERRERTTSPASDVDKDARDHAHEDHRQLFLTTKEAATLLKLTTRSLDRFRAARKGPAYCRIGNRVYYARADLLTWVWSQRVNTD